MRYFRSPILLILVAVLGYSLQACAAEPANPSNKENPIYSAPATASVTEGDIKSLMYTVLAEISSLQEYMVSEKKFLDPKNDKVIANHIQQLSRLSTQVLKTKKLQVPGYRLSGEALDSHFQELKYAYNSGNKKYARWMLSATPYACASCHTQIAHSPKPLWELNEKDLSGSVFEKADFLFATRNYAQAEKLYTQMLRSYAGDTLPNTTLDDQQIETVAKRKLSIFVRINRDFKNAEVSFSKDLQNKKLPKDLHENMKSWITQLKSASKQDPKILGKPMKVIAHAAKVLDKLPRTFVSANNPQLVDVLNVSSLLYQTLHAHPRDELTASLLFWLGVADLSLNNEFFFSLGSTYLKECMREFPKTLVARRCFAEYEADVKNLYTGTRGTDIPEEVAQELKFFRARVGIED